MQEDDPDGWDDWTTFASPTKETLLLQHHLNNPSPDSMKGRFPPPTAVIDENLEAYLKLRFNESCRVILQNAPGYDTQWDTLVPSDQGLVNPVAYQHLASVSMVPSHQHAISDMSDDNIFQTSLQHERDRFIDDQIAQHQQEQMMTNINQFALMMPTIPVFREVDSAHSFYSDPALPSASAWIPQSIDRCWPGGDQQSLYINSSQVDDEMFEHASNLLSLHTSVGNSLQSQLTFHELELTYQQEAQPIFHFGQEAVRQYSSFDFTATQNAPFHGYHQQEQAFLAPTHSISQETQLPTPITATFPNFSFDCSLTEQLELAHQHY